MQQSRKALLEVVLLEADGAIQPLEQLLLQRGLTHLFGGRVCWIVPVRWPRSILWALRVAAVRLKKSPQIMQAQARVA